jgi:undecaprenyl-diphosphatase
VALFNRIGTAGLNSTEGSVTLLQAIVLGVVQGLTEFLPISSTAHLRVVPALLDWPDPGAAFTAVTQIGTLVAVFAYFRADIARLTRGVFVGGPDGRLAWMIAAGTVPILVCGVLLKKYIEGPFRSLYAIAATLILLALVLMAAEALLNWRVRTGRPLRDLLDLTWADALLVGTAQALALVPGTSRSGITLTAGLLVGMSRPAAARFAFLLSLPSVLAAGVYELYKDRDVLLASHEDAVNLLVATVVAGVVGYGAIAFLMRYLKTHSTYSFIVYRLLLGGLLLGLLFAGHLTP